VKRSLKTTIVAAIVLTIVGFWVISGVVARRHAASVLAEHENHIHHQGQKGEALNDLRQEKHSLFRELTGIRFLAATAAVVTLSITLGLIWRIHEMRLGTWSQALPVDQDDEMGKLTREFNELGPELSFTAHQYAAASKLAAMALIGHRAQDCRQPKPTRTPRCSTTM
jgi:hypothetical protein